MAHQSYGGRGFCIPMYSGYGKTDARIGTHRKLAQYLLVFNLHLARTSKKQTGTNIE